MLCCKETQNGHVTDWKRCALSKWGAQFYTFSNFMTGTESVVKLFVPALGPSLGDETAMREQDDFPIGQKHENGSSSIPGLLTGIRLIVPGTQSARTQSVHRERSPLELRPMETSPRGVPTTTVFTRSTSQTLVSPSTEYGSIKVQLHVRKEEKEKIEIG